MKAPPVSRGEVFIIPVSSLVATFEQSENVAIAHVHLLAMKCVASATASICTAHSAIVGNLAQAGYYLCINYVSMFCEHVLLIDDNHIIPLL